MAASDEQPGPLRPQPTPPELLKRGTRSRGLSQIEFEISFYDLILERDPLNVDVLSALAGNLVKKGELGRALALDRRLVRLRPERSIVWYDLACSYSLLGLIGPSLHALGKALDLGYRRPSWVLRDPHLKGVRRDPRFLKLLRRWT